MTLRQAVKTHNAARNHESALSRPGARCSDVPCAICAAQNTMLAEAIDGELDKLTSAPKWLIKEASQARSLGEKFLEYLREGRKAYYNGKYFYFVENK